MKHKILRSLIATMLIFVIIYIQMPNVVQARGLGEAIQSESGYAPNPPTPPHSSVNPPAPSEPSTPSGPQTYTNTTILTYPEVISGNVYEDLGEQLASAGGESTRATIGAKGVTILLKKDGAVVSSTVADESGNYSFRPGVDGTYTTEFLCGDVSHLDLSNTELVKSGLRYNGYDYRVTELPSGQVGENKTVVHREEVEVKHAGKGAAQVYLAVDCSYSVRTESVVVNGTTTTRLALIVESTKSLINSLLDSGENIYIGLVFFSGTNYRAVSLTKNKEILNSALAEISGNNWYTANTNIYGALETANNSYYNTDIDNSNRTLILVSDGIPTSNGSTQTYCDEPVSTSLNKVINTICPSTRNKILELRGNGIRVISLFTYLEEADERELVESTFYKDSSGNKISDLYLDMRNTEETIKIITEDIKNYLIETTEEKEFETKTEYQSFVNSTGGSIQEIQNKFTNAQFNYENTKIFEIIENYNPSTDKEKAQKFGEMFGMKVIGGTYNIQINPHYDGYTVTTNTEVAEDGNTYIYQTVYRTTGYYNQNIGLEAHPTFYLNIQVTATALKIILADGSVLEEQVRNNESETEKALAILQSIDDELAHGATIEIEYTISIKNPSSIQCNHLELINYLPEGFFVKNENVTMNTRYDSGKYECIPVKLAELLGDSADPNNPQLVSTETAGVYKDRNALRMIMDNNGQNENGFYLSSGRSHEIKYVATRVISSIYDIKSNHNSVAEVLVYENHGDRRMAYTEADVTTPYAQILRGLFPGDNKGEGWDLSSFTNAVFILPPTGYEHIITKIILGVNTGVAILLLFAVGIRYKTRRKRMEL